MIYAIVVAILAVAFGGWTWYQRNDAVEEYEAKLAQAELDLMQAVAEKQREADNHITDMQAAYEVGEAEAKVITRTITVRGASDVVKYPVFSNPECVLPAPSLLVLNGARAGLLPAADPGEPDSAVPGPAAAEGRQAGDALPADAGGRGAVSDVPAAPRSDGGGGAVPGQGVRRPKPVPLN